MAVTASDRGGNTASNLLYLYSLPSGVLLDTIGETGYGPKQFKSPKQVKFVGPDDNIIVADCDNIRLQEFTSNGGYKRSIPTYDRPTCLCVSDDCSMVVVGTAVLTIPRPSVGGSIVLLDYVSGSIICSVDVPFIGGVSSVNWKDGAVLVTSPASTTVYVYAARKGSLLRSVSIGLKPLDCVMGNNDDVIMIDPQRVYVYGDEGRVLLKTWAGSETGVSGFKEAGALSLVDGRLYVLDYALPLVHVYE